MFIRKKIGMENGKIAIIWIVKYFLYGQITMNYVLLWKDKYYYSGGVSITAWIREKENKMIIKGKEVTVYIDEIVLKKIVYFDEEQLETDMQFGDLQMYTKRPYKIEITDRDIKSPYR